MERTGDETGAGDAAQARPATPKLRATITLVGLMGAGKSSVGRVLAQKLGAPFRDSDDEIEAAASMTIPEIFARYGEAEFRAGEERVIGRLMRARPCVLATGGGAFMSAATREAISAHGVSVWLEAELDVLVERTARKSTRPLLAAGDPRAILADLIGKRYPVYRLADVTVDSPAKITQAAQADKIIAALRQRDAGLPPERRVLD